MEFDDRLSDALEALVGPEREKLVRIDRMTDADANAPRPARKPTSHGPRLERAVDRHRHHRRPGPLHQQHDAPLERSDRMAVSAHVENDDDYPIRTYDKILFNPKHAIPVDFEADNQLYVVPIEDVVAVFRRPDDSETSADK